MFSIVIPAYNAEATLPRCLNSLFTQTWTDFKAIVVDNASYDKTGEIARAAGERDSRFCCIYCGAQGVGNARNAGIDEAGGEYILFLDADDELLPDALETLALFLDSRDIHIDIILFNVLRIKSGQKTAVQTTARAGSRVVWGDDIHRMIAETLTSYLPHSIFKCYRTAFLVKNCIRFSPILSLGEDLLFNLTAYEKAGFVGYISRPLYKYHLTDDGLTARWRPDIAELKTMLHERLKEYLIAHGVFSDAYYELLLNDVFVMLAADQTREGIRLILESGSVKELLQSHVGRHLPLKKKLILIFLRLRLITPLHLAVKGRKMPVND